MCESRRKLSAIDLLLPSSVSEIDLRSSGFYSECLYPLNHLTNHFSHSVRKRKWVFHKLQDVWFLSIIRQLGCVLRPSSIS